MVLENNLFTISEIAKRLHLTRQAVDHRIRKHKVPVEWFGKTRVVRRENIELIKR